MRKGDWELEEDRPRQCRELSGSVKISRDEAEDDD